MIEIEGAVFMIAPSIKFTISTFLLQEIYFIKLTFLSENITPPFSSKIPFETQIKKDN